jgi:phage terminase small subunit
LKILNVDALPEYQKKGVSNLIMKALMDWADKKTSHDYCTRRSAYSNNIKFFKEKIYKAYSTMTNSQGMYYSCS